LEVDSENTGEFRLSLGAPTSSSIQSNPPELPQRTHAQQEQKGHKQQNEKSA
jgi:hypothetical protein